MRPMESVALVLEHLCYKQRDIIVVFCNKYIIIRLFSIRIEQVDAVMLIFRFRQFCYFQIILLALVESYHLCDKVKQFLALSCHCFKFLLGHFVVVRYEPLKFVCHSNDNSEWSAQLVCDAAIEFLAFAVCLLEQDIPFFTFNSRTY